LFFGIVECCGQPCQKQPSTNTASFAVLYVTRRHVEARDLLAGVYRHFLVEVRDWLVELVETLADPMVAVKKRGLPTVAMWNYR